jgi:citrate lyase subunit beta/citryl-CoA lyase
VFEIAAAAPRLKRLCFGAGDFSLDVGVDWPHEDGVTGETLLFAKSQLVLASRMAGLEPPHDSVYPRYDDLDALRREATESRRLGFLGKHAIHPSQLPVIDEVYRPSDRQVERARRLVAAFDEAEAQGKGAVGVDGELVDYPILYRARNILAEVEA